MSVFSLLWSVCILNIAYLCNHLCIIKKLRGVNQFQTILEKQTNFSIFCTLPLYQRIYAFMFECMWGAFENVHISRTYVYICARAGLLNCMFMYECMLCMCVCSVCMRAYLNTFACIYVCMHVCVWICWSQLVISRNRVNLICRNCTQLAKDRNLSPKVRSVDPQDIKPVPRQLGFQLNVPVCIPCLLI